MSSSTLIAHVNSILERFAKEADAELTTIQQVTWKGEPQSTRYARYIGTDWEPLYKAAVAVDLQIIHASIEARNQAAVECEYIKNAADYFIKLTAMQIAKEEKLPCSCGGHLVLRINSKTTMGFYSCTNWTRGCKITKNLLKEDTDFSKKAESRSTGRHCPKCGKSLIVRTAKTGKAAGKQFIGCAGFPACTHTEAAL